jgi:hypothetical protein
LKQLDAHPFPFWDNELMENADVVMVSPKFKFCPKQFGSPALWFLLFAIALPPPPIIDEIAVAITVRKLGSDVIAFVKVSVKTC